MLYRLKLSYALILCMNLILFVLIIFLNAELLKYNTCLFLGNPIFNWIAPQSMLVAHGIQILLGQLIVVQT